MKVQQPLKTDHRILLAFYEDDQNAERALNSLLDSDVPMDRISVLGQASSSGDDPLGIYYPKLGDRMVGWGKMGALWGGLWGMVTGAMGMFLIPGLAPMIAAGPIVEALIGAAGGASIGGGALAGSRALSQLGVAVHRMGLPQDKSAEFHQRLKKGEYLLMVIVHNNEVDGLRRLLSPHRPTRLADYPYVGFSEALKAAAG